MNEYSKELNEVFNRVAQVLKNEREARGLTIQDIATHTRINRVFLERIEQGDLAQLPGLAFVIGFLRNYVQSLELQDESLDQDITQLGAFNRPEAERLIRPNNPDVLDHGPESSGRMFFFAGGLAVLVVLAVVLYFIFSPGDGDAPPSQENAVSQTRPPASGSAPGATQPPQATNAPAMQTGQTGNAPANTAPAPGRQTPPTGDGAQQTTPMEARQTLELTVRGLDASWLRLSTDGGVPVDVHLDPADTLTWEAEREFRMTIGKSRAVAVYLNGEEIILPQDSNKLIPDLLLNRLTLHQIEN